MPEAWVDRLLEHEIAYFGMIASCERSNNAIYLTSPSLPQYHDTNRALRLRTAGKDTARVAADIVEYFKSRGLPPIADVDPVAESQGFADALLRAGLRSAPGDRLLMRYGSNGPPPLQQSRAIVHTVTNESGNGEARAWVDVAVSDDGGEPDEAKWRAVSEFESKCPLCRLYMAWLDGHPAGVCDLFEASRWGRVESVVTRPESRRRGVASCLVARAVTDSLTSGNFETYLFTEPGTNAERVYRQLGFVSWHMNPMRRYLG